MKWVLAGFFLLGSMSEEIKELSEQAEKLSNQEAREFLKGLQDKAISLVQSDCSKCRSSVSAYPGEQNLLVFMSFSVPLESWQEWSYAMEKYGGVFVLRGLPGNSFKVFSQKVTELRKHGVKIPIQIDSEAYEKYKIETVPSLVFLKPGKQHKISGNIGLEACMRIFMERKIDGL